MKASSRRRLAARARLQLDERRTQLLALGMRLFSERPYDDVSIDDIAAAAGISKGLLYHYFGSKRALYVETVREAAKNLLERVEPDPTLPPAERARAGIESYLVFVEEHERSFAALMRSGVGTDPEVASIVEQTRDRIAERMMQNMGIPPPRPIVRFVLRGWIGMVEAASLDWLARRSEIPREVVVRMAAEALYASLGIALRLDPECGIRLEDPPPEESRSIALPSSP